MAQIKAGPEIMSRVVFNLGLGYLKVHKKKSAKLAFEKAASLDPKFDKANHNLVAMKKAKKVAPKPAPTEDIDTSNIPEAPEEQIRNTEDQEYNVIDMGENEGQAPSFADMDFSLGDDLFEDINLKDS